MRFFLGAYLLCGLRIACLLLARVLSVARHTLAGVLSIGRPTLARKRGGLPVWGRHFEGGGSLQRV